MISEKQRLGIRVHQDQRSMDAFERTIHKSVHITQSPTLWGSFSLQIFLIIAQPQDPAI
jgi:hypothetical protein